MSLLKQVLTVWVSAVLTLGIPLTVARATATDEEIPGLGPVGEVERVAEGFQFVEGPAKTPDGSIYFTDIPAESIHRLKPDGEVELFLKPSGFANGLMYGGSGQLLACQMDGRLVSIDLSSKQITVLADSFNGKRFNACNDLVIDKQGGIYFTDPRYRAPEPWPQEKEAFYYRSSAGDVTRLGDDLRAPNGIILSPDEQKLYVIPSLQRQMMVYDVTSPGVIANARVFCELEQVGSETDGGGDGLAIDEQGNLYITSAAGVQVFAADGNLLGIIKVPEQPANCAFGGSDNKTLYITARTGVYRCAMPIAGHIPRVD
jgi:gluconolactonase